jgi:xanthine dehydrogenase molybdopterin binding subunit/xanthine dehydrogenase small subunit
MADSFTVTVNGTPHVVHGEPAHRTLLQWLRASGLTGTKEGCAEGDCGACTVTIVEERGDGTRTYRAINSCIALLPMFAGREVWTVEGLAERTTGGETPTLAELHPVQRAMAQCYGSQCGYCTPGFVVSMFEGYYRDALDGPRREEKIAEQLHGNLCRCTGYRPIRDAMVQALEEKRTRKGDDLFQLRLKKPVPPLPALDYEGAGERFLRPTTLVDLLRLRADHPGAHLVAGATEIGVEINKKARAFPVLISTEAVSELRGVKRDDGGWTIGGAATLTEIEEGLAGAIPALDKMLWVFASRQIRSRATLAGNLVTASPIGDMAPVLLALGATITLAALDPQGRVVTRTLPLDEFFVGYRATAMRPGEIVTAIRIPAAPAGAQRLADSFKVSKRRELDISIVAAAFVVDRDAVGNVLSARIAFGGVAATPVRALKTEALLVGKPWTEPTLRAVLPTLFGEASPIDDVRAGKDFRRGLVATLFEKFFRGETSESQDAPLTFAPLPSEVAAPPDPSRELLHESAIGHVTGSAIYVDDEAHRRGPMLELWPVRSPHAHARIVRRDATRARSMPGVHAVLFAEDIPGDNDIGAVRHDETLLAADEVLFHGHMVAVVVGESYEACRAAAAAVEVEYEPLPAIRTIEEAIAKDSFHTQGHRIARGDAKSALAASPHVLEGTLAIGGQEHFYLEAQAAWAECGDDGDVHVTSSTQHPSEIQQVLSHVLALPRNRIVVSAPRMGGGFGGKETQGNGFAALVALAAWKLRRPVRVQLDRDLDMQLTGKRHPFRVSWKAGFDDHGLIRALVAEVISDGGWALDLSESINDRALFHIDNCYFLPNVDVFGRVAKTNNVSHTAFRGFGGPQGMVAIEDVMDRIARTLGLPPEEVRRKNLYRDGDPTRNRTPYEQVVENGRMGRIWPALEQSSELAARRAAIARFNASSGRVKRGIAITPVKFGISFTATFLNQAGALLLLYRDGTLQVNHGGTEMGQGLYTKLRGVAMRELGLSAARVRVMKTRTDKVPNTSATAASSGADLNGAAVRDACETLRARLAPVAAAMLTERAGLTIAPGSVRFENDAVTSPQKPGARVGIEELCARAYMEQVSLSATGYYRTPGIGYDRTQGRGKPFYYFAFGAAVTEVEVDSYSGMKRVRRVDVLHDVGDSLHDAIDRGQIEGAFVQGMGWLTGEELKWDDQGRLLTHSASTYQIPAFSDAPFDFRVTLLREASQPGTIHGSKAVGEPPLMLAISVREAIRDAIAAFGDPGGLVDLPSPATHEAIWHAIQTRLRKRPEGVSAAAEE